MTVHRVAQTPTVSSRNWHNTSKGTLVTYIHSVRRSADAVADFLAEAQVTRRPHELWELTQKLLQGTVDAQSEPESPSSTGSGLQPRLEAGFSDLAVCCLRSAFRVVSSSRMPPDAQAAVTAYTAGIISHCQAIVSALIQLPLRSSGPIIEYNHPVNCSAKPPYLAL